MLLRIVSFLLESLFFVLIAAALLRAWMNWLRINMRTQPGQGGFWFVIRVVAC